MSALGFEARADGSSGPHLQPDLTEAQRLLDAGFSLVRLHAFEKRPIGDDWNKRSADTIDPNATGYGIPLASNELCSIDPDHVDMARAGLRACGFELDELMAAGVQTKSTRPGSGGRSAFAADEWEMLRWLTFKVYDDEGRSIVVLELRAKSENLQDCAPGVVYRDKSSGHLCTQMYANGRKFDDAPPLPDEFARVWRKLSTDDEALREFDRTFYQGIVDAGFKFNDKPPQHRPQMGSGEKLAFPSRHRGEFNRSHTFESVIEAHGYAYHAREQRWSHPGATGAPGIRPIPGKDDLWQSDHAGDPLHGTSDAWAAHVQLDHHGDVEAANKAFEAELRAKGVHWPAAHDIFGNLEPPAFPVDVLPSVIQDFATDQAELMGVDPGILGIAAITILASVTDDRIRIQPKRHDPTWTESARLWFAPVGQPSSKKSPALGKAMGPAFAVGKAWREHSARLTAKHEQTTRDWEKAGKKGPPPEPPLLKRLIFEDTTIEKMAEIMAQCEPRGVLVFRDELTGWLSSMDAYKDGGGADRAAWLEAFNGGGKSVDRVRRGSTFVENWSACVIGGIQPSVIEKYASTTNHDGMIQRFLLYFAQNATQGVDRRPDMAAKEAYADLIKHVADTQPGPSAVVLSEDAHGIREALWTFLHRMVQSYPNAFLTAALGKWEGISARLMLTFHVADCAARRIHPSDEPVSGDTAEKVARLMRDCLLHHAILFYASLDAVEDKARDVAGLLLAHKLERFTVKRDLPRHLRNSRKWKECETAETIDRLDAYGWIAPEPGGRLNERGRPASYVVNPTVHQRFAAVAESERQRRAEVAEMMRELRNK